MAVVKEFALPDLGEGLTEAEIVRWLVEVGDVVAVDQPVVEVETAKAMVEVPCPYAGVVTARYGEPGDEVPVGRPLVTVAVGEQDGAGSPAPADGAADGAGRKAAEGAAKDTGAASGSGSVLVGYGTGGPPPRRRRVRPTLNGDAPAQRTQAVEAVVSGAGPVAVVSPLVRRLAREHGLDLRSLRGTGTNGLILRSDVEKAIAAVSAAPAGPAPTAVTAEGTRIPLRGMRGAVAEKLSRSRREIPDAT